MVAARPPAPECTGAECSRLRLANASMLSDLTKWRRFGREQEDAAARARGRADAFAAEARIGARRADLAEARAQEAECALAEALRRS